MSEQTPAGELISRAEAMRAAIALLREHNDFDGFDDIFSDDEDADLSLRGGRLADRITDAIIAALPSIQPVPDSPLNPLGKDLRRMVNEWRTEAARMQSKADSKGVSRHINTEAQALEIEYGLTRKAEGYRLCATALENMLNWHDIEVVDCHELPVPVPVAEPINITQTKIKLR